MFSLIICFLLTASHMLAYISNKGSFHVSEHVHYWLIKRSPQNPTPALRDSVQDPCFKQIKFKGEGIN